MADSSISITAGSGTSVDTRTETGGQHRQVVVFGHPSATDSVAEVLGKDPASNTEGIVVRDPYSTNIVSGLRDVRVQSIVDGTMSVENLTRVRNIVDGTLSTVVRLSNLVDGTLSTVSRVSNVVDGTLTTITGIDRVRNIIDGTLSTVSFIPQVQRVSNVVDGTLTTITGVDRIRNIVDGTITTVTTVTGITNSITVYSDIISGGTDPVSEGPVKIGGKYNSTKPTFSDGQRGDAQLDTRGNLIVTLIPTNTASTAGWKADNSDGVATTSTADKLTVISRETVFNGTSWDRARGGSGVSDAATRVVHATDVASSVVINSGTVTGITNSIAVHVLSTNGTMAVNIGTIAGSAAVYFSPSKPVVLADNQHTANIFTVAGSISGNYPSGFTLVAPSANASFKVFAFSLQTTGIVSCVARFTNGGESPTEFFRGLVTANQTSSTPIGANLAVQPPGFLFATGVSTTLALLRDADTLVHYSVSYFKESV